MKLKIIFLFQVILLLSSCVIQPVSKTKVASSSVADWHQKWSLQNVFILIDNVPFAEQEKNDLLINLRNALSERNIDNTSYVDSETIINHAEVLRNKLKEFNTKYVLQVSNYNSGSLLWRLVSIEDDSEVWKGFTPFYVKGKGLAEAVINDMREKEIL